MYPGSGGVYIEEYTEGKDRGCVCRAQVKNDDYEGIY